MLHLDFIVSESSKKIIVPLKTSNVQLGLIIGTVLLLFALLFLGRTTPHTKKGEAKTSEEAPKELLSEEVLLAEARNSLDTNQIAWFAALDKQKSQAENTLEEAEVLKLISRTWFEHGNYIASGYYAKKVAELLQTGKAWAIAGTTYDQAYRRSKKDDERKLAVYLSIEALGKAKELEPDSLEYAINEALMYVELSTVDATVMPMKGIMMMRALDEKHENNVQINMTLGRMSATRTRDMAKAKPRFEKVISIAQKEYVPLQILAEAYFYLIECYKAENNKDKVLELYDTVIDLTTERPDIKQSLIAGRNEYLNTDK